ncbi:MAG: hypothetical protein WC814_02800 [Candidatus Paceibacterota bacterium]|jgi:hypothetical protein
MLQNIGLSAIWLAIVTFGFMHGCMGADATQNRRRLVLVWDGRTILYTAAILAFGVVLYTPHLVPQGHAYPWAFWILLCASYSLASALVGVMIAVGVSYFLVSPIGKFLSN